MNNAVAEFQAEMPGSLLEGGQAGGHAEPESEWRLADGAAMIDEADFDERGYLRLNPDVAAAVARGDLPSGFHHYMVQGFGEGRRVPGPPPPKPATASFDPPPSPSPKPAQLRRFHSTSKP